MGKIATSTVALLGAGAFAFACSTFSSRDDESGDGGTPVVDGAAGDVVVDVDSSQPADTGADASDADASDAGSCDLVSPTGEFLRSRFDQGNCDAWTVAGGSTTGVASPTRCGVGACRICANTTSQILLQRTVPVVRDGGTFQLDFQIYGETMAPQWTGYLDVTTDGGMTAGGNGALMSQGQWKPGQIKATNPGVSNNVAVRLYTSPDAGDECYVVDEMIFSHY